MTSNTRIAFGLKNMWADHLKVENGFKIFLPKISSISASDLVDDASSATSSLNGPLYELSKLMAELHIK
ncbi:hypothetical protein DITRI_Ditri10aG0078200 [Diplodiscus trichospermus]